MLYFIKKQQKGNLPEKAVTQSREPNPRQSAAGLSGCRNHDQNGSVNMKRLYVLSIAFLLSAAPVWGQSTQTQSYQLSVTIPSSVNLAHSLPASKAKNPAQLAQKETLVRNNRAITFISIVVP